MNPYDFVRIDWSKPPKRRAPVWHHRLVDREGKRLFAGRLEVEVYAETPLFIVDPRAVSSDPKKPDRFIQNSRGEYIIPGSSLKGMLRGLVETLGNGCLTLFDGQYERQKGEFQVDYKRHVPFAFQHCTDAEDLCIACRLFGMLKGSSIFLGKVNIGDACVDKGKLYLYDPIYTKALMEPKPHHASFYLDESQKHIAGRKFYFHHSTKYEPLTENKIIYMGGRPANRFIQPLDYNTQFHFRVDFTNLEADEFAALLLAVVLEEGMRHKIGYGKPLGLGSIYLFPTSLTLVDYASRYTTSHASRGKEVLEGKAMWEVINKQFDDFDDGQLMPKMAMDDLKRIWRWPADPEVDYYYPSKRDWFDTEESIGKRIADTRNVP